MTSRTRGPATSRPPGRLRLSPVGVVSFALAAAGLLLGATVNMAWLVLFGLGVFGAPLLREAGWLRDRDELQRAASARAGRHAYLAGGVLLMAITIVKSWGVTHLGGGTDSYSASSVLTVMLVVYLMSYLLGYWGAQRAASRVLVTFGIFWGAFILMSHATQPMALLMESLLLLPFFGLAWASGRWPRVAGGLLIAAAIGAFLLFDLHEAFTSEGSSMFVLALFFLPLLTSGIALVHGGPDAAD